jgi:membrane protein implicated in regulation of membrane protease activity
MARENSATPAANNPLSAPRATHPDLNDPHRAVGLSCASKTKKIMDFFQWHWWAAAALFLMIAEIFLPGFFMFCLGVGCVAASITAGLGFGAASQLLMFSIFSLIAFFTVRPLLMKRFWSREHVATNADALVGQRGRVSQDFDPGLRLGRVQVGGDDWRAECISDTPLRTGDTIEVIRVESNTLIVKPLTTR